MLPCLAVPWGGRRSCRPFPASAGGAAPFAYPVSNSCSGAEGA